MDTTPAARNGNAQVLPMEGYNVNTMFPLAKCPSSRRTPSLSSSSSLSSCSSSFGSSSYLDDFSPSPITPLRSSGVPFSWERLPGIPKKPSSFKMKDSPAHLLPLPPPQAASSRRSRKVNQEEAGNRRKHDPSIRSFQRDPFFTALVECSKDDHDTTTPSHFFNGGKIGRSISDRFGLVSLYTSCKRTCAVTESIIYLPRSNRTTHDDLVNRRCR